MITKAKTLLARAVGENAEAVELRKRVATLEIQCSRLKAERDEAREKVVLAKAALGIST